MLEGASEQSLRLIVGLGNPGRRYQDTRHNIGFMVLDELARRVASPFREERRLLGGLGRGFLCDQGVILLKPTTFMNESGQAVRRVMQYYKLPVNALIVVSDDVALPFGDLRLRAKGSSGGHNGLKSIQQHVGSNEYCRLRMGVGDRTHGALHDHVLGRFSRNEQEGLGAFIHKAADVVQRLCCEPIEDVMNVVNQRPRKQKPIRDESQRERSSAGYELNAKAPEMGQESKDD